MSHFRFQNLRTRALVGFVLLSVFLLQLPLLSFAQTDIVVRGSGKKYPLAIPELCFQLNGSAPEASEIDEVLGRNLDLSGYFEILSPEVYIETPGKCDPSTFAYSDWSVIGAEGLVKGIVKGDPENLTVQLYLHDVQRQQVTLAKEYSGHPSQSRAIAHRFANEIMRVFTGKPGVFGSKIAFSSRVGRFKELFVMDMDGSNIRQLTDDRGIAISSSWNPTGTGLVYTSYRRRVPELFFVDVFDRQIQQITSGPVLDLGGQFSNDGQLILASQSTGKQSDIVLLNRNGSLRKRVTSMAGVIDVSPKWSPDNTEIAFCSNRAGGPQIYVMGVNGGPARRISFVNSNYCTSPAWSPDGERIAFVCRAEGNFQIFTARPDGTNPLQLTSYGSNEDPEWSPDGSFLVFATTFGKGSVYSIALMRPDGSNVRQLTNSRTSDTDPAWGPVPR